MSRWFESVSVSEKMNIGEPVMPIRSTKYSAGYDFYAPYDFTIEPGEVSIVWTDLVARMEDDEVLLLYPRSSLGIKYGIGLANSTGVIDADYLRNIGLPLTNNGNKEVSFTKGEDKLVQGIFFKYLVADNCNSEDERTGGLGSTS